MLHEPCSDILCVETWRGFGWNYCINVIQRGQPFTTLSIVILDQYWQVCPKPVYWPDLVRIYMREASVLSFNGNHRFLFMTCYILVIASQIVKHFFWFCRRVHLIVVSSKPMKWRLYYIIKFWQTSRTKLKI